MKTAIDYLYCNNCNQLKETNQLRCECKSTLLFIDSNIADLVIKIVPHFKILDCYVKLGKNETKFTNIIVAFNEQQCKDILNYFLQKPRDYYIQLLNIILDREHVVAIKFFKDLRMMNDATGLDKFKKDVWELIGELDEIKRQR